MIEKNVLIQIDNVRVVGNDERNVIVERLEETTNPITKNSSNGWRFKGYSGSILDALRLVIRKELLIDKNAVTDLESYLKSVVESNDAVLEAIKKTVQ